MNKLLVLSFLMLLNEFSFSAPVNEIDTSRTFELSHTHRVALNSASGTAYELVVSLPASYKASPDKKYPVLYYTDAYWDAPLLSAIYLDLAFDGLIPEMIMVGLSYSGDKPDYPTLRRYDLTLSKDISDRRPSGGGDAFLAFIKTAVIPKIERDYRAESDNRTLAGWSLGGLFTIYTMYKEPDLFNRHIAISPSISWNSGFINQIDDEYFRTKKELESRLFVSYAADENFAFKSAISDFQIKLDKRNYRKQSLMNYVVENMGHAGGKSVGYSQGLVWIWKDADGRQ